MYMYLYMYIRTHAYHYTFSYKTVTYDICVRTYSLTFTYLQLSNDCVAFVYNNCYCCSYIDIVARIRGFVFWESFFCWYFGIIQTVFLSCISELYFLTAFLNSVLQMQWQRTVLSVQSLQSLTCIVHHVSLEVSIWIFRPRGNARLV